MSASARVQMAAISPKLGRTNADTALNSPFWAALLHVVASRPLSAGFNRVLNTIPSGIKIPATSVKI